jgi:hypothetical protein
MQNNGGYNDIGGIILNYLTADEYIMYLRKSRADNPNESVEEVLAKHEGILQELAERDLGGRIPAHCIYREIVSGETVSERPEMLNVLAQIENPRLKGVLVVDPQRLSRGDLEDCGKVVNAFRYSRTGVVTPNMVYDLTNKMQRKFFEQELMRGNDFLEYTKEILLRGRIASVKRGNYIGNIPPFGYDKIKMDGYNTLEPNEYAPAVLMAFEMYVNEGKTYLQIARHFDKLGIKPYRSKIWEKCSITAMLKNRHYIGYVVFGAYHTVKEVVNGEIVTRKSRPSEPDDIIIAKGKHPAIVPLELFEAAQAKMDNNPRAKWDAPLKNPLAGLLWCQKCGRAMAQHPYKHARTRIECRNRNGCGSKSAFLDDVVEAVAFALEMEHLPDLEAKLTNNEGSAAKLQRKQLEKLSHDLEELYIRQTRLHDFLEDGTYTKEVFNQRMLLLSGQIEELRQRIFDTRQSMPQEIDYADRIVKLKKAIEGLRDDSIPIEAKNKLLKAIVKRIDYEYVAYEGKGKVRYRLHIFL